MCLDAVQFGEFKYLFELRPGHVLAKTAKDEPEGIVCSERICEFPYIVLNRGCIHWLHIDIDFPLPSPGFGETSGEALQFQAFDVAQFDVLNIPPPVFSVLSGRSVHHFWALAKPLPPCPSKKSLLYYLEVRRRLIVAIGGDLACAAIGVAAKNPFFKRNHAVRYPTAPCALGALRVDGETLPRAAALEFIPYEQGQRNHATFLAALKHYCSRQGVTAEELNAFIESFQATWPAPPLTSGENRGIIMSILQNAGRYRVRADRNYGVMGLPTLKGSGLQPDKMLAAIRHRQAEGARYSVSQHVAKKTAALELAITSLGREGQKLTGEKIAAHAGVSLAYVRKRLRLSEGVVTWK